MAKISEIISSIEDFAPLNLQESWDNCGVQVGFDLECECTGAVLALDVTTLSLEVAIERGANLLITHHPLTISGIRQFTSQSQTARIIALAIKHNITIYSAHTSLDSCRGGLNDYLAEALKLNDSQVLVASQSSSDVGLGRVGTLSVGVDASELAKIVKSALNAPVVKYSDGGKTINSVALCSGSGGSLIPNVKALGVDAYICSDLKYHNFDEMASSGITLIDVGHFESEICAIDIFKSVISKKFPTFAVYMHSHNCIRHL